MKSHMFFLNIFILLQSIYKQLLASILGHEIISLKYSGNSINILFCNSASSNDIIAIMCPKIQKAFITTPTYFSTVIIPNKNLGSASLDLTVINDSSFVAITTDNQMLLISSETYFYLFKSYSKFKKIKYPFDTSHQTIISQIKLFPNHICANAKQITYPFTNYIYILHYNYDSYGTFTYISMNTLYQLPTILQLSLLNYHLDSCNSMLNIPITNTTACLYVSDYNILAKGSVDYSYLYIFLIQANEFINIKMSIVKKIKLPMSCGYKMIFLKEMILFGCPLLHSIGYCEKGANCNNSTLKMIGLSGENISSNTFGYDMTMIYSDRTRQDNLIAVPDVISGKIYLLDIFQSQFNGLREYNINSLDTYNMFQYSKEFFSYQLFNPFVELMIIYDGSHLLLWNSNLKGDKYIFLYQVNNIDNRVFIKSILSSLYCRKKDYIDDNNKMCVPCSVKEISNGGQSTSCNQCSSNDNPLQGYYCPDYCEAKKFGLKCDTCQEYLKTVLFTNNEPIRNEVTYSDNDTFCEFYCSKDKVANAKQCIEENVYSVNNDLLLPIQNENIVKDQCVSLSNCYSCYQLSECSWCENTNICMLTSTKRNCTVTTSNFFGQYKCLSAASLQKYTNEKLISVRLKTDEIGSNENYSMVIFYFSYTYFIKLTLSLTIFHNRVISDIRYYDYLTEKYIIIDPLRMSYTELISTQGIFMMITVRPGTVTNSTEAYNLLEISLAEENKELSSITIVGIVFGCIAFITLLIGIIFFIKRKQKEKYQQISINQRINNYDPLASHTQSQMTISLPAKNFNVKEINAFMKKTFKDEKSKKVFIKRQLSRYPVFILTNACENLSYYSCSFCEKKFVMNNHLMLLDCNHIFHSVCIQQQLITNEKYSCLLCGCLILSIPQNYNQMQSNTPLSLSGTVISNKDSVN